MAYNGRGRRENDQPSYIIMKIQARIYNLIREKVQFLYKRLGMEKRENPQRAKVKDPSWRFHRIGSVLENKFSGNEEVFVERL